MCSNNSDNARTTTSWKHSKSREVECEKHISKSLENIRTECHQLNGANKSDPKRNPAGHRRCRSYSNNCKFLASPGVPLGGEHSDGSCVVVRDEAVSVDEIYGGRDAAVKTDVQLRLLVISSKIRNTSALRHALHANVICVCYNYDSHTLDDLLGLIQHTLGKRRVSSFAFILSCTGSNLQLCSREDKVLTKATVLEDAGIKHFFTTLCKECLEGANCRVDFLACTSYQQNEVKQMAEELELQLGVPVGIFKDFYGADHTSQPKLEDGGKVSSVGELYFKVEKLRGWSGRHQQSLAGFEKIRTVGKGAYGAAVLYKKKDDDSLVILKEINMHDLNASERQLALNEVSVLALLDHPNIISYYDSFEEDGVLMIEIEYADGGTLAQFLSQQEKSLEEKDILTMFQQIVAAIRHIHEHNILHRLICTYSCYHLSYPDFLTHLLCEGKQYSFKSDIWALGCILYEMACLQKTFEGSNLPALVNKIMKGQFAPVKGSYSAEFRDLIMDMLQKEAEDRPAANEIMYQRLPVLMSRFEEPESDPEEDLSAENISKKSKIRSVLYYMDVSTCFLMCFSALPPRMKIRQVAIGPNHVVVITMEHQVYSWGEGNHGQLGHGNQERLSQPVIIEALKGKSVSFACCGDGFSIFASNNGLVLTCGDGSKGCLGHGDWSDQAKPRLIETLLSLDVTAIACGTSHVVAVGSKGEVFSWGQGADGRLGLGSDENHCVPAKVKIDEPVMLQRVWCGEDGTMFLSDVGSVFACGSNENNKLGLNNRQGFLMAMKNIFTKTEVEGKTTLTPVRALARHRVTDISMGPHHSAVIVESGHVYMFGRNSEGQLGTGNQKSSNAPVEVKSIAEKSVNRVQCGKYYTVVSTKNHELYYWGLRFTSPSPSIHDDTTSQSSIAGSEASMSAAVSRDDIRLESVTPRAAGHSRNSSATSTNSGSATLRESAVAGQEGERKSFNKARDDSHSNQKMDRQVSCDKVQTDRQVSCDKVQTDRQVSCDKVQMDRQVSCDKVQTDRQVSCDKVQTDRQVSCDSLMSHTDSGIQTSSTSDFRPGFRPLSSLTRRSISASSRENVKEKEKEKIKEIDKDKELFRDDSVLFTEPKEIIRIKQENEKVLLGNFFCHGENLFIQLETTAPPPRKKALKKRSIRKRSHHVTPSTDSVKNQTASSRDGGDEYSSEASEIDSHAAIPAWLREELTTEAEEMHDGNEADDTTDQSDTDLRSHGIDSSMSSIQISRALTPVSPRVSTQFRSVFAVQQTTQKQLMPRPRTVSATSSGSNLDIVSDTCSSASEPVDRKQEKNELAAEDRNRKISTTGSSETSATKLKVIPNKKVLAKKRLRGKGSSKSDVELKDQIAARGFVSDATVKRREESLLYELDQLRTEKRIAEAKIRNMESEQRLKQEEVERHEDRQALRREEKLKEEIECLKVQLQSQSCLLQNNQKMVHELQTQLSSIQSEQRRMQLASSTPRAESRASTRSSKVCSLQ
ncbi:uncharacterized protein LOC121389122 [Gigantopelta aegis]|uniref:uncharacterized protein LOC121389122 n=1 Tax=Gigantopelta aegis TaxID=1735272 RepID=UPI001B889612|nr:uncharacterized protein LOC121389122 [Gigantopelta aegis]